MEFFYNSKIQNLSAMTQNHFQFIHLSMALINRLLPVGIVAFRYIYTCRSSWVQTASQRKSFNIFIGFAMLFVSISLSIFCCIYREKSYFYLRCLGKEDIFHSEFEQFDIGLRLVWLFPIYHPFHLLSILAFFSFTIIVPLGYVCIYTFRRQMNRNIQGLSDESINFRKKRNLVTTKYNLFIWISEVFCSVSILFSNSNIVIILYFALPSTVSPILYFIGILENREHMRIRVREIVKESKGKWSKDVIDAS